MQAGLLQAGLLQSGPRVKLASMLEPGLRHLRDPSSTPDLIFSSHPPVKSSTGSAEQWRRCFTRTSDLQPEQRPELGKAMTAGGAARSRSSSAALKRLQEGGGWLRGLKKVKKAS